MTVSSWKRALKAGGIGAAIGAGAVLGFKYSKDEQSDVKTLNGSRFKTSDGSNSPYWTNLSRSSIHQGMECWNSNWDKNQTNPNETMQKRPRVNRHLILIRHGHYERDGKSDKEKVLTQLGRSQAQATGLRIAELDLPIDSIVSSTKSRAQETSGIIAKHISKDTTVLEDDPTLNEGSPYPPEPLYPHLSRKFRSDAVYEDDGKRIEEAFQKYFYRPPIEQEADSFEIIVCHANVIRYFILRALQLPPEAWIRMTLKHASMSWISINDEGYCTLLAAGDAGHLRLDLLSSSRKRISYRKDI